MLSLASPVASHFVRGFGLGSIVVIKNAVDSIQLEENSLPEI
jgi:hypothetical protein